MSTRAIQVITGTPLTHLLAEGKYLQHTWRNGHVGANRRRAREQTLAEWQGGWREGYPGTHPFPMPKVGEESPGDNHGYWRRGDQREYDSHNDRERDKLTMKEKKEDERAMRGRPPVTSKECLMTKTKGQ
ncbi:hypothetical protein JTB14_009778 [Gonioctena quinquepunctata]|nr:hypothetical protein JTB14_009778 [Gonioctena quinquepunctata]